MDKILAAVLAFFTSFFIKPAVETKLLPTLLPTPTPIAIILPAPTPTPTPTPIPSPTPTPTPTAIPIPVISGPPNAGLSYVAVKTDVGTFNATIMAIDLSGTRVVTDTGNNDNCTSDCVALSLADYVTRNGGYAGVNGSYFCPDTYPDCSAKKNSFDFPVYNTKLDKWINGDKLGWNERRAIVYIDGSGAHYQNNSAGFGGGLNAGIINYPGLLDGGNVQIDENQSGLSDKQKSKGLKMGIGVRNQQNIMVVAATNVNMREFGYVFKALGATGALNLDVGGSTAMIFNGRYVYGPGRKLPNAVVFVKK